ncbi:MAG TPA: 3-oxoacyl-[acyl-carrier-protein] reductase [Chloroflexota bacterium]|nr:3-oxoacyl-[acyl-carrier-protein] reductase [Chloroflexota bacterium]
MEGSDRVALITGASRGIGRAIASRLAQDGLAVVINYARSEAAAREVVEMVAAAGGRASSVQADVADFSQAGAMVERVVAEYGRLDVLVNNAGITRDGLLMRMSEEDWDAVLDTNLKGAYSCTRAALRAMLKRRHGRIINISSVAGLMGNAGQANYSASKAGLLGFTRAVAREVAGRNVTVNAVAPGYIETEIWSGVPEAAKAEFVKLIPMGRTGLPEEVAQVVSFLASDASSYMTGQVLCVDGGMVMN